jgi:drug/metabolite transporter (DMT)-like permease
VTSRHPAGLPSRPSGQSLGVLLVVVSACSFGSGPLLVQPVYDAGIDPLVISFWRFLSAALFSWAFLALSRPARLSLRGLPGRRIAVLALLGVIYVGNSFTYVASLEVVPISLSSIITYLYPAVVAVLATRFVRRLEGRRAWLALGISLLGVALAVGGVPQGGLPPLWGLALSVASPLIYAVWIVLQSRVAGDRPVPDPAITGSPSIDIPPADAEAAADIPDPSPAAAIMTSATALVFGLLTILSGRSASPADVPGEAWLPLLGMGLVATAVAIRTFYAGVRRVGGARAALISTVEPIYSIVMAMILFGERLTPIQVLGGALVIGGVVLAETGRSDGGRGPAAAPVPESAVER